MRGGELFFKPALLPRCRRTGFELAFGVVEHDHPQRRAILVGVEGVVAMNVSVRRLRSRGDRRDPSGRRPGAERLGGFRERFREGRFIFGWSARPMAANVGRPPSGASSSGKRAKSAAGSAPVSLFQRPDGVAAEHGERRPPGCAA